MDDRTLGNLFERFATHDFDIIIENESVDNSVKILHDTLLEDFNLCCPLKSKFVSYKDHEKPWINHTIKILIKKRQLYLKLYKLGHMNTGEYCNFRNYVTKQIKLAKRNYYNKIFDDVRGNIIKTWKIINNVLKPHTSDERKSIKKLFFEGRLHESDFEIAEAFNNFFSTVGANISETFPVMNGQYKDYLSQNSISNSFFFSPIHSHDVSIIINSLKNKTCHHS